MQFEWKKRKKEISSSDSLESTLEPGSVIYSIETNILDHDKVKLFLAACIDKAVSLLDVNITQDSCYFMCEWNKRLSILSIVVTDDTKALDSLHIVQGQFKREGIDVDDGFDQLRFTSKEDEDSFANNIQYWLRDYLTTSTGFMAFSLVAAFHCSDRVESVLL